VKYLAALLLVATCVCTATADAKLSVVAKGIVGAAAADGGRLAAWGNLAGALVVLDDRTGTKKTVDLGRPCARVYAIDGSDGLFLVNCGVAGATGSETHQLVVDVATGEVTALVASTYRRIGRYWVQGTADVGGRAFILYTAWQTGESRMVRAPGPGKIQTPFDLDSPDLDPIALAGPEFVVGSSMALAQVRSGKGWAIRLVGATTDRRLYRCAHRCQLVSLKGGLALWRDGARRLLGYAYASKHGFEWRIPASAVVRGSTAHRVYYLMPQTSSLLSDLRSFAWR
jgi:hypothetical protein